jgi:hypothetical protein
MNLAFAPLGRYEKSLKLPIRLLMNITLLTLFLNLVHTSPMGLYHPLDGITNLKYKLLYFITPKFKEKGTSF